MKKKITCFLFFAFFLFLSLSQFYGCAAQPSSQYTKNGKIYGVTKGNFRNRWWNFYERGMSFAEGGFYAEAIDDFREAINKRERDQRRARSYGMHFLDYFPHREMGIALYHLKKYQEAIRELETSLTQEDSAKAKYFLNKAREAQLILESLDTSPPFIRITSPQDGTYTNAFSLEVSGVAEDDKFVSQVEINGTLLFIELAQKVLEFRHSIALVEGPNLITVKVRDLTGKETEKTIRITTDRQGPLVSVEDMNLDRIQEGLVFITCSLLDETGLSSFNLGGKEFVLGGRREAKITEELHLKTGEHGVVFEVKDVAGNITRGEISLSYAQNKSMGPPLQIAFLDETIKDLGEGLFSKTKENIPLTLNLKDLTEKQTVYYETIFIDGNASGPSDISSITINGIPLLIKPARNLFFNYLAHLREGENRFEIKAIDKAGNSAVKQMMIIREIPKVKRVSSRMSVLLLPFEIRGQGSIAGDTVYDALLSAFVNQGRFNMVTRERLEEVLKELKLSKTDLVDPSKALKGGRMIAAEGIIIGSVNETRDSIEIYARLINTETTSVLAAKDVFSQDKSIAQLRFISEGLALKFEHSFPLVEGQVVKVKGKDIYVDSGLNKNIKKEMKFIVYREGEKLIHPVTGKVLGCDSTELGEVRVEEVFDDFSKGKLFAKSSTDIKVRDKVITK